MRYEELPHDAVRQFFFVPLALFAQECYTLAIKDSVLSARFFGDKEKRLCESD
jgi:hypothetical protein